MNRLNGKLANQRCNSIFLRGVDKMAVYKAPKPQSETAAKTLGRMQILDRMVKHREIRVFKKSYANLIIYIASEYMLNEMI